MLSKIMDLVKKSLKLNISVSAAHSYTGNRSGSLNEIFSVPTVSPARGRSFDVLILNYPQMFHVKHNLFSYAKTLKYKI